MFCPRCGSRNAEGVMACVNCGWSLVPGAPGAYAGPGAGKPDNYLAWAILATLFCCQIFGVISIVYAAQVDSRWASGDAVGAEDASRHARNWAIAAFASSFVWIGFILLALVLPALVSASR